MGDGRTHTQTTDIRTCRAASSQLKRRKRAYTTYYFHLSFFSTTVCLMISISVINPDTLECKHSTGNQFIFPQSLVTHKVNVYFGDIPKLVAGHFVIIVSIYVLFVLKRLLNAVLPINLANPPKLERCF